MNLRQVTLLQSGKRGTKREWSIRRILLPLLVCMLAMVAGQGYAQEITEENEAQWVEAANQGNLEASYKLGCYYYDTALEFVDMFLQFEMGYDGLIELDDLDELAEINENVWLYLLTEHTKAAIYWKGAAEKGHAESQYRMGEYAYSDFKIGDADHATAANWFRKAAAQGHAKAKAMLEKLSSSTPSTTSSPDVTLEDVARWRLEAELGDAKAQANLGVCYSDGLGVTQNYTEAVKWFRKAAEQGHANAQVHLGFCYYEGFGVTQNYTEAVKWFRKAAEQGLAEAQFSLGGCYSFGNGVTQNDTEAVKWLRKAAEQGLAEAQYALGCCYYGGMGVTRNNAEAANWLRKAAAQGHADAKAKLEKLSGSTSSASTTSRPAVTSTTSTTTVVTVSPKGYADFFPVYGVLPGKTTVSDVKALGYIAKSDGDDYKAYIQTLTFWDFDGNGVFKDIYMVNDDAMPDKWRELGLDWKLSYDEWLALFQRMGFSIEHTKAPETTEYSGRNTLSAAFVATSPDQTFTMDLTFNYGNGHGEGYSTRSKRSLYSISVKLNNKPSVFPVNDARALSVASVPAVRRYFSDFFPVYGVTIGRSTIADVKALDYAVKGEECAYVEGLTFWNHNGDQIFEDLYVTNGDPMPEKWQRLGLDWRLSYDEWLALFQKMGFAIEHTRSPGTEYNALSAEFVATAPDGSFTMRMNFNYGNQNGEGRRTSSRNSLYSISMDTE